MGGGVIFRVKRRREDEPLDALLVAERAPKRGSGVSLQACMDSLSIGAGAQSTGAGEVANGAEGWPGAGDKGSTEDMANSSCSSAHQQDSTRKVFKLLGSVPHDMDTDHQHPAPVGSRPPVCDTNLGDVSQSASPGGAGGYGVPGSAETVRELIRKMTSEQHGTRPAVATSAQRQKELARIVDLEVEQSGGGAVKFRSAPSPGHFKGECTTSPVGPRAEGSGSPASVRTPCSTPAGKGTGHGVMAEADEGTEVSPDGSVGGGSVLLCNGSPLIRETVDIHSPGAGAGGDDAGMKMCCGGQEGGDEYVYDYYWIDPDEGGAGRDIAKGKVANVEVDLGHLWDDDRMVFEEDDWDSDQIEESGDQRGGAGRHWWVCRMADSWLFWRRWECIPVHCALWGGC